MRKKGLPNLLTGQPFYRLKNQLPTVADSHAGTEVAAVRACHIGFNEPLTVFGGTRKADRIAGLATPYAATQAPNESLYTER